MNTITKEHIPSVTSPMIIPVSLSEETEIKEKGENVSLFNSCNKFSIELTPIQYPLYIHVCT
jgi:hypothetical protein